MHRASRIPAAVLTALCMIDGAQGQPGVPADAARESTGVVWLRLGGGTSDNITRVPIEPESGTFTAFGVDSDLVYMSPRLNLDFSADFEHRKYASDDLDNETYGEGQFSLDIDALPDRIVWLVRDDYSQGRVNPFEVTSPENRAEANQFSMGPRFNLPLGQRTQVRLEALQGDRTVEDAERLDSETETGTLSFVRAVDTTAEFALNLVSHGVEYESPPTEIETESAYLSYSKALSAGEAYLAVGQTRSERGGESDTTPYIDLAWARAVGARSRLELNAVQEYVDFFDDQLFGSGGDPLLVRDVYEQQLISVLYSIEGTRNRFSVSQSLTRADYTSIAGLDYEDASTTIQFSRSLTEQMRGSVRFSSSAREYESAEGGDDRSSWALTMDRRLGRQFALGLSYESHDDDATVGQVVEENIVRIDLRYALTNAAARSD